jgi:hypothetical protein
MRNRSFVLDGHGVGTGAARLTRAPDSAIDHLRIGWLYWLMMSVVIVAGAGWRAYAPGARAPGLSAMVFVLMIAVFYVLIAFPLSVASAVASVRWPSVALPCLLLAMVASGTLAAGLCSIGRLQPEWDVLALYGGIVAALAMQVFTMTRKAWRNDRA